MAFELPTFNLLCNIADGPQWPAAVRVANVPCNLAWGKRVQQTAGTSGGSPSTGSLITLLLPALTDVRDGTGNNPPFGADLIEVPSGSGRWYYVTAVDDIGKGFANEHRACPLSKASANIDGAVWPGLFWPIPMP